MTVDKAITYLPSQKSYIAGEYFGENANTVWPTLLATSRTEEIVDANGVKTFKIHNTPVDQKIKEAVSLMASNKQGILSGSLKAADFDANRDNLSHLTMIQLDKEIRGQQAEYFHLDHMFSNITVDQLLYRYSFQDNVAAAQKLGPRQEYDTTKVTYDEVQLDLEKTVVSWDIALEDTLRPLLDATKPLINNNLWSMMFQKEKDAAVALSKLKYHYKKSDTGTPESHFTATTEQSGNTNAISNPETLSDAGIHSEYKPVNEINTARNLFLEAFDIPLDYFACSPETAAKLAQNTWTRNNTIFNVEAYRTSGGVRGFPGLDNATMVISLALPENILYATNKANTAMLKADGPKITKVYEVPGKFTMQHANADFYQYKCAHEDLSKITRKFGCIIDLSKA